MRSFEKRIISGTDKSVPYILRIKTKIPMYYIGIFVFN